MIQPAQNNLKGILYNVISMLLFVLMDILVKILVVDVPVYEVIFYRCLVGIPIFAVVVHFTTGLASFKIINTKLQIIRAVLGVFGMFCFFNAYKFLPMADAASILFSAPIILTVLTVIFFKEKIGLHRGGAIILGFIGVLFITRPSGTGFSYYMLLPLAGAIVWSLVIMTMRVLSRTDHANAVTLVFSLFGTLVGGVLVIYNGGFSRIDDFVIMIMLLGTGVIGIFAQLFMTMAVQMCQPSVFGSTKYISLVFSVMAGFMIFGEVPAVLTFVGIGLIILSGLYIVYREHRLNKIKKATTVRY